VSDVFELRWTARAREQYDQLRNAAERAQCTRQRSGKKKSSKQEGLFRQVHKSLQLLRGNPKHPGLETHEYTSIPNPFHPKQKVFEAYAQNRTPGAYRIFWCYGPDIKQITIIAITPHP